MVLGTRSLQQAKGIIKASKRGGSCHRQVARAAEAATDGQLLWIHVRQQVQPRIELDPFDAGEPAPKRAGGSLLVRDLEREGLVGLCALVQRSRTEKQRSGTATSVFSR